MIERVEADGLVQIHSAAAKAAGLHIAFKFDVDPGQNDKRAVLQNGEHNKPLYIYSKGVAVYDAGESLPYECRSTMLILW